VLKVLHLISGGDDGGAKTHVLSLIKQLQKQIDVTLVCFIKTEFYTDAINMGIDIKLFEQKQRYDLSVVKNLTTLINENNYDLVHCHGARANFLATFFMHKIKVPSVTTVHSDFILDFQNSFYKQIFYKNLNVYSLKKFNYYIAVSDEFKRMLISRKFPEDKIFTVYNGVDFDETLPTVNRLDFLKQYNLDHLDNKIILGILARLHPVKGHKMLFESIAPLISSNKDIHLLLAGDGDEKDSLIKHAEFLNISDNIHFLGFVNKPLDVLNAIDINLLTSYSESFPYVLLEGALLKKPTVASSVGGIPMLIINEETGLTFKAGCTSELTTKLNSVICSPEKQKKLGENLYKHAKENYSLENLANTHIKIYKEIISKGK